MEKKYQQLLSKLEREMERYVELSPLERMRSELSATAQVIAELRAQVETEGFVSQEQEIEFFRSVKPSFQAFLILSAERYSLETTRPLVKGKGMRRFLQGQLDYIDRFFALNGFFYQYYKLGSRELDSLYFLRGAKVHGLVGVELPALDPVFATVGDYLFAKFIALEKLREMVVGEMQVPIVAGAGVVRSKKGKSLRWTGDSCNLIELVYGIFDCRQVNNGEVDLSDLMDVFEQCFQINLSRYFRRFTEIKRRKSMSKTRFLDEMARVVNKRIDDGDAYVPMSMR
jgi:hypothetical protein